MGYLPPLASTTDLSARLGRPLTASEETRAYPLLQDASAQIRRYCRNAFTADQDITEILYGHDSEIELPRRPVNSVSTVVAIGGGMMLPDVNITWFTFDGVGIIRIHPGHWGIINLPESWIEDSDSYPGTFRVTYNYGWDYIPDIVTMVAANAALSVLTSPTVAAGVVGETIGPYSYRMEAAGGGVKVALTQADLELLKDYRRNVRTLQSRLR